MFFMRHLILILILQKVLKFLDRIMISLKDILTVMLQKLSYVG